MNISSGVLLVKYQLRANSNPQTLINQWILTSKLLNKMTSPYCALVWWQFMEYLWLLNIGRFWLDSIDWNVFQCFNKDIFPKKALFCWVLDWIQVITSEPVGILLYSSKLWFHLTSPLARLCCFQYHFQCQIKHLALFPLTLSIS